MYKFTGFTEKANRALNSAVEIAENMGHTYIGTEHLLAGIVREDNGTGTRILQNNGVTLVKVENQIRSTIGVGIPTVLTPQDFTPKCKYVIELSVTIAKSQNVIYVGTEHLLLALIRQQESSATVILKNLGVGESEISAQYYSPKGSYSPSKRESKSSKSQTPTLDNYSVDLTGKAEKNQLDGVIGRDEEIARVIQILSRRTKNNPCLVGEPGVGKTAIAEGLALKIFLGEVPETLKGKRVVSLDLACVVAGTKYRGDFEERIKKCIDEVIKSKNIILFIDEVHNLIGTGSAEGAVDAANILKPFLARSELQLIGATTFNEYKKYIEKDSALERRFAVVKIGEPSESEAIEILKGIRDKYEAHHKLKINDSAIISAVLLSKRYLFDRFLPDKAIDLLDEACAKVRLKNYTLPPEVRNLEDKLKSVNMEKAAAISAQDFEAAASLRDEEKKLIAKIGQEKTLWKESEDNGYAEVTSEDITEILSSWTGIPLTQLSTEESERLLKLEEKIGERIIGQKKAVEVLSKAIRRGRSGLKDEKKPIGTFLFLGPTGVGKTELCKALATVLFGDERAIIRFDMSEFMASHNTSRLIGSPPGYVGHEEGGELTEKIRQKPYSIVLFDEIEKAHSDVFNVLLQIMDDGILTDSQGRKADFKNTVIIMTSNIGAEIISGQNKSIGFMGSESELKDIETRVNSKLKKLFRPEFLNRIDETVIFSKLTKDEILKITKKLLNELGERLKRLGITMAFSEKCAEFIAKEGFDETYGARPIKRAIQRKIEDLLSLKLLEGKLEQAKSYVCDVEEGRVVVSEREQTAEETSEGDKR